MREQDLEVLCRILEMRGGFGHREHLELTWNYLGMYEIGVAHQTVARAIRHVANLHGLPDRYHETITRSWVHLVAIHRQAGKARSFDEFIAHNPGLLDRHLLERHYSRELIASSEARTRWVEPDVRQLPAVA
jgi:hypothetical protein